LAVYAASAFEGATLTARVHASVDAVDPTLVPDHAATLALGAGDALRFTLAAPPTALDGAFSFAGGQGVDVYLRHGAPPTVADHDLSTEGATDKRIAVAPMAAGLWHVLLVAAGDAAGRLAASVNATPAMREARPLVLSGLRGNRKILRYDAPAGVRGASVTLSVGTGDADLYLKRGQAPTPDDHDGASERPGNDEQVTVAAGAGTYYVLVVAADDYSLGRLVAAQSR
jgi:hypothetical protein